MRFKATLYSVLVLVGCTSSKNLTPSQNQDSPNFIKVSSFNPNDQTQCKDVSQTQNIRPKSCPPVDKAQALAFMSFRNQGRPLEGFGIGDSILNVHGECANLDAKYSTYYQGLKFWNHTWILARDAKRLKIGPESKIKLQSGRCR